ncbi:MAG: hypothetical protein WA688_10030 [Thermoplasmata archaeon]
MFSFGLEVGGFLGVILSAGFVYFEVGKFAAPQVPISRFNESKALMAYVVGLFVGIPLALVWIFFEVSVAGGNAISAIIDVVLLAVAGELAQTAILRTHFFGFTPADPFYVLAMRAGIGGLLTLGTIAEYLGGHVTPLGIGLAVVQSVALVLIQVTAGLRGLLPVPTASSVIRQRLASLFLQVVLFLLAALGEYYGTYYGLAGAGLAIAGAAYLYWDARPTVLAPARPRAPATAAPAGPSRFDRLPSGPGKRKSP